MRAGSLCRYFGAYMELLLNSTSGVKQWLQLSQVANDTEKILMFDINHIIF